MTIKLKAPEARTPAEVVAGTLADPWDERDGIVPGTLNVGDAIVYGVTHEVELPDRTKIWPKLNASTTIRPSETAEQATDRLVGFVHDQIALRIKQAVEHSATITL